MERKRSVCDVVAVAHFSTWLTVTKVTEVTEVTGVTAGKASMKILCLLQNHASDQIIHGAFRHCHLVGKTDMVSDGFPGRFDLLWPR